MGARTLKGGALPDIVRGCDCRLLRHMGIARRIGGGRRGIGYSEPRDNAQCNEGAMAAIDLRRTALPAGAMEFFATFARFEFALKDTRHLGKDRYNGAKAKWGDFANDLGPAFFECIRG